MKFVVFSHVASAYGPRRFKEEAQKRGILAESLNYHDLDFKITQKRVGVFKGDGQPLPFFDIVIFRSAGGFFYYVPQRDFLVSFLAKKGALILNRKTYEAWARLDKLSQYFLLSQKGLPIVETELFANEERMEKNLRFPSVVKNYFGSQGKKVFKVEKKDDLQEILKNYLAGNLLIQPVLPGGEDIRVIVLGGKAIGAMKRIAQKGAFLTNYSAGGMVENYPLDEKTKRLAEKTAEVFFLDYVGVDLMKDKKGQWRILEVNRACQFEGFEKATGINVAEMTIEWLLKKASR